MDGNITIAIASGLIGAVIGGFVTWITAILNLQHQELIHRERIDVDELLARETLRYNLYTTSFAKVLDLTEQAEKALYEKLNLTIQMLTINTDAKVDSQSAFHYINKIDQLLSPRAIFNQIHPLLIAVGDDALLAHFDKLSDLYDAYLEHYPEFPSRYDFTFRKGGKTSIRQLKVTDVEPIILIGDEINMDYDEYIRSKRDRFDTRYTYPIIDELAHIRTRFATIIQEMSNKIFDVQVDI